jgi:protein TonB
MLAYAANRPVPAKRHSSPNALLIVISAHVALLAVVISAKMDLPQRIADGPIKLIKIKTDPITPPPPAPVTRHPQPQPTPPMTQTTIRVPLPPLDNSAVDTGGAMTDTGPIAGAGAAVIPVIPNPVFTPIHHDPRLLTPPSELKPPYPPSKILSEEEATLRLRLTIDEHGRVVAVDPVSGADKAFLDAARRHLIAHWRYQPATEDGRAVASSMVITLRFQLDG